MEQNLGWHTQSDTVGLDNALRAQTRSSRAYHPAAAKGIVHNMIGYGFIFAVARLRKTISRHAHPLRVRACHPARPMPR